MYALIYYVDYSKRFDAMTFDTIEAALDRAEMDRLKRAEYGVKWWIAEPMERRETFIGANGTHETKFDALEANESELEY